MRNIFTLGFAGATIAAVTCLGCAGTSAEDTDTNATTATTATTDEALRVQPGHGNASVPQESAAGGEEQQAGSNAEQPTASDDEDDRVNDALDPNADEPDMELEARADAEPANVTQQPAEQPGAEQPPAEADQQVANAEQPLENAGDGVAQSQSALSTTTGTTFDLTYYVIALRPKGDANSYTIRDCNGKFLTYASSAFRADATMQGTARFKTSSGESKTINAGPGCWITLPYSQRWGLGVTNPASSTSKPFALKPFRSIAVDRSVLTVGKWYYIKQLDGVRMPYPASTTIHDGCVRAVDVGPAIKGKHIDFYVGYRSAYKSLINGSSKMGGRETITLYSGATKCAKYM